MIPLPAELEGGPTGAYLRLLASVLTRIDYEEPPEGLSHRYFGGDWPATAETMIGIPRLADIAFALEDARYFGTPGDFVETGVWRGGACIWAAAVLDVLGEYDRRVWVCDSFRGLPPPSSTYPIDEGDTLYRCRELAVSLEEVRANFDRYGLLTDRIQFIEGWFEQTLPTAPIEQIAVLRLDGDMYGSTWCALHALYPRVSAGGWVIIDDYKVMKTCAQAVDDYRDIHGVTEELRTLNHGPSPFGTAAEGAYLWQKR